jgi:uncharacterized protein
MNRLKMMMKSGLMFLTFSFYQAQAQDNALAIKDIEEHRKKQHEEFLDAKSPLTEKDRKKFKGLKYFPIDLKYRVNATFTRTEGTPIFKMKTTTTRLPEYVKYGEVTFKIDSQEFKLEVYQSPDLMKTPGYEDYLFIPFTDLTNGDETYEVGRYIEFRIPDSENVIIDFNKCYNPYCSYNGIYSCPIPPTANQLPIRIPAGEKKFKAKH